MSDIARTFYRLTFSIDLPKRRDVKEVTLDMRFYPRDDTETAEYHSAMIEMRDGLRAAGRDATLELVSDVSEVVA